MNPVQVGLVVWKRDDKLFAGHAGSVDAQTHDDSLLGTDAHDGATQRIDQQVKGVGYQLEFKKALNDFIHRLLGFGAGPAVFLQCGAECFVALAQLFCLGGDLFRIGAGIFRFLLLFAVCHSCFSGFLAGPVFGGDAGRGGDLVNFFQVDETVGDIRHAGFASLDVFQSGCQQVDGDGEGGKRGRDLDETVLDALGDTEFALTGQQFNGAHFPHIHADWIGRAAKFTVDTGEGGSGLLGGVFVGGDGVVAEVAVFEVGSGFVDGDPHVVDHPHDIFDLFRLDNAFGQVIVNFRVGQESLFLSLCNQLF